MRSQIQTPIHSVQQQNDKSIRLSDMKSNVEISTYHELCENAQRHAERNEWRLNEKFPVVKVV